MKKKVNRIIELGILQRQCENVLSFIFNIFSHHTDLKLQCTAHFSEKSLLITQSNLISNEIHKKVKRIIELGLLLCQCENFQHVLTSYRS